MTDCRDGGKMDEQIPAFDGTWARREQLAGPRPPAPERRGCRHRHARGVSCPASGGDRMADVPSYNCCGAASLDLRLKSV